MHKDYNTLMKQMIIICITCEHKQKIIKKKKHAWINIKNHKNMKFNRDLKIKGTYYWNSRALRAFFFCCFLCFAFSKMVYEKNGTCVANTSSSPTAKSAMKTYKFFEQKALKQKIAPSKVAPERSCRGIQTLLGLKLIERNLKILHL